MKVSILVIQLALIIIIIMRKIGLFFIQEFKHDEYININFVAFFLPGIIENDASFIKKIIMVQNLKFLPNDF